MDLDKLDLFNSKRSSIKLEMSKNRSKKIMITDIAIQKIPYIEYEGIPKSEYKRIQDYANTLLTTSMNKNNSNEVALTYCYDSSAKDIDTNTFYITYGDEHSVDIAADTDTYHLLRSATECTVITLHNHPSLSLISLADIRIFIFYFNIKLSVVISNLGCISYLIKSNNYDASKAINLLNQAIKMNNRAKNLKDKQEAAKFFLKNCSNVGIKYHNGR